MKPVNTDIPYVTFKKNKKYPINGRQHTYEDIYNMYQNIEYGKTIPYHGIHENIKEYTTDNNIVNTSLYTDVKDLNTTEHKLVYNTLVYTYNKVTNTSFIVSKENNYLYNNVDNNLPNNLYNSEIHYDISTFIYAPEGIYNISIDNNDNIPVYLGNNKYTEIRKLLKNIIINTHTPDDIRNKIITDTNAGFSDALSDNDFLIISRSNIKYPDFNVDINDLTYTTKNIDWYDNITSEDLSRIGYILYENQALNIKNDIISNNIIKEKINQNTIKQQFIEKYNILYDNLYYTIIRLSYNTQLYDRIMKYKINIHIPDNNYNIPLEFVKLSNLIFIKWNLSYNIGLNNNYKVIPYDQHTKQIRESNYNGGWVLPPITPVSMGILPQARANGSYPTNAYHYVYGDTQQSVSSLKELIAEIISNSKKYQIENNCRYNNGENMPWTITKNLDGTTYISFKFYSVLYEFPAAYASTGNTQLYGTYTQKPVNINGNNIFNNLSQFEHNIMFFMSFARFLKDDTGVQIFNNNFTVYDFPVKLDINISHTPYDNFNLSNDIQKQNNTNNVYLVNHTEQNTNSIYNPNRSIALQKTISLEFPSSNIIYNWQSSSRNPKYLDNVQCSIIPPSQEKKRGTIPLNLTSTNITGMYGSAKTNLEKDPTIRNMNENSGKTFTYFKWEANAQAIISPNITPGSRKVDPQTNYVNDIYNKTACYPWLSTTPIIAQYTILNNMWNKGKYYYTQYITSLTQKNKELFYNPDENKILMDRYFIYNVDNTKMKFKKELNENKLKKIPNIHQFTFDAILYELVKPDMDWIITLFPVN